MQKKCILSKFENINKQSSTPPKNIKLFSLQTTITIAMGITGFKFQLFINNMPLIQYMALIQFNATLDINYDSKQRMCAHQYNQLVRIRGARICNRGQIFADIREFLRIRIDTDIIFDNPTDTDSESLTANLHDKLRRIALHHYADCRNQTALCSIQLFTLVARQSPLACSRSLPQCSQQAQLFNYSRNAGPEVLQHTARFGG